MAGLALEEAEAAQPHAPQLSERRARLALALAEPWLASRWLERAHAVKTRGFVLMASARRLRGEGARAEKAFRRALAFLTGPPDCPERAFYGRHLAVLRREQGELEEAAALLWRAAAICRERGQRREEGLCLAQLGAVLVEQGQPEAAAPLLTRALWALDEPRDAGWCVRCLLALAYCRAPRAENNRNDEAFRRP